MMVGDRVLTLDEAEAMARERGPQVGRELLLEERQRHLQWVALARQTGFDRRPEVVEAMEQVLADRMAQSEMGDAVPVSDEEVRRAYETQPDRFLVPEKRRLAVIRIQVPAQADESRRERYRQRAVEAREALAQATAQAVGDCVARYSDDNATRLRGGDAGWLTADPRSTRWPAALHQAALGLARPGDCTGLIEVADGFVLGRLLDLVPAARRPFAEVQEEVRWILKREAQEQRERQVRQRLDAAVPVRVHDSNRIRFLHPPDPPPALVPSPLPAR